MNNRIVLTLIFLILTISLTFQKAHSRNYEIKQEIYENGIEHVYREHKGKRINFFYYLNEIHLCEIKPRKYPFGKSIAILIGIDKYQDSQINNLDFVNNDIKNMRDYLISEGGFDEIFIIRGEIATRTIIEDYVKNKIPQRLKQDGRLLLYYSGHGGCPRGAKTGYMLFSKAQKNNYTGDHVLSINDIEDWCAEIDIRHMLFIIDSCVSGLAFTTKGNKEEKKLIENTLNRKSSRIVITAGTGEENTWGIKDDQGGSSIFSRAFLNVIKSGEYNNPLISINEIIARIEPEIRRICADHNQPVITPRLWSLDLKNHSGNFLFINPIPSFKNARHAKEYEQFTKKNVEYFPENTINSHISTSLTNQHDNDFQHQFASVDIFYLNNIVIGIEAGDINMNLEQKHSTLQNLSNTNLNLKCKTSYTGLALYYPLIKPTYGNNALYAGIVSDYSSFWFASLKGSNRINTFDIAEIKDFHIYLNIEGRYYNYPYLSQTVEFNEFGDSIITTEEKNMTDLALIFGISIGKAF